MSGRPEIPEGYLGSQPKFAELRLQTITHDNPEFSVDQNNELEIKFKMPRPIKVTSSLIQAKDDKDISEYVFTQTKEGVLAFVLMFPEAGYYKFQIFGLEAADQSKSLPNVYNYLIHVKDALRPAYPFPKQYAQWKDGCYLYSPLVLNAKTSLAKVEFKVYVPNAKAVAVVAAGEWFHLTKHGENWEGTVGLSKHRGKDVKVTLNANYGSDETKYATLLEYII
ncbi:unnamed protein product [Candidula unifasciata]|uniref:KY-like immunoglobulin-like domain-containing protein n=1 Tax=Candidula unifasciata TaxID=100452 RepID=A0A8S3YI66_9EUPU|nr:unnamed protein product [Candidula unifasciata]